MRVKKEETRYGGNEPLIPVSEPLSMATLDAATSHPAAQDEMAASKSA